LLLFVVPGLSADEGGILTFHGDPARTGWNRTERTLTPATAGALRKLWTATVDGEIYAEPLVVPGLAMFGRVRTVVYVVTEQDLIYAFDAAAGRRLWGPVALGAPVPRAALSCGNIDPAGITSTPVVDRSAGTLYAIGLTTPDGGRQKTYKIAALDVKSGSMRPGWPVEIAPPSASGLRFDAEVQQQRGALAFARGVVYVPFGGYWGDCGSYHGWVVGVPVSAPRRQEAYATPTDRMGGIWAAGGLAIDPEGRLYAATGNSDSAGGRRDLGNSVVRLLTSPLRFSGAPRDYFTPSNAGILNAADTDLGSTAPLVLPDLPGSATPHLVFIAGKQGVGYLLNRDDLGGPGHGNGVTGEGVYSRCVFGTCEPGGFEVASATAYWDGGTAGRLIFVPGHGRQPAPCGGSGGIVALRLGPAPRTRTAAFSVAWCGPSMRDPGAPAVSGEGPDGIVWVVDHGADALYALDARSGRALYVSRGADALNGTHQFITPSVWGGRVYVGAGREVAAYGLPGPVVP
jgi:hypothetical protein